MKRYFRYVEILCIYKIWASVKIKDSRLKVEDVCFSLCQLRVCIYICGHAPHMWGLKVFAVFCGLAMHSVMNYEKILKANARQKVALEVLSFHASSSPEETERIMVSHC